MGRVVMSDIYDAMGKIVVIHEEGDNRLSYSPLTLRCYVTSKKDGVVGTSSLDEALTTYNSLFE